MIRRYQSTSGIHRVSLTVGALLLLVSGCGTIKMRDATNQLLISDAVDQTISQLDFGPLSGSKVFLDTRYIRGVRGVGFVNADYITSALRERMATDGCLLQDEIEKANYVVEVRIGALGTDGHEVNYGIPGNNAISTTTSLVGGPVVPPLPELSLARKDERRAAVKVGVFAYHRESREPVWQPGMVQGNSVAKATWVFGAGPFHDGKIYNGTAVGGDVVNVPDLPHEGSLIGRLLPKRTPPHPTPDTTERSIVGSTVNEPAEVEAQIQPVSYTLPDPSSA